MHNTQKEVSLKYSIVIPAHNEEKYIADTLKLNFRANCFAIAGHCG